MRIWPPLTPDGTNATVSERIRSEQAWSVPAQPGQRPHRVKKRKGSKRVGVLSTVTTGLLSCRPFHFLILKTFTWHYEPKLKVVPESVKRLKSRLREVFRRGRGRNLGVVLEELRPALLGWVSYYRKSEVRVTFEQLDQWMRRKLRAILWRQWKRPWTRAKALSRRGLPWQRAWISATNGRGPWWNAAASYGTVRTVVWEDGGGNAPSYPMLI